MTVRTSANRISVNRWISGLLIVVPLQACGRPAPADLPGTLKGISKPGFLACSGPPSLEVAEATSREPKVKTIKDIVSVAAVSISPITAEAVVAGSGTQLNF